MPEEAASGNIINLTIPRIPVGVNNYVKHTRSGRHYVTPEARAFKEMVSLIFKTSGQKCVAKEFGVSIVLHLGDRQKLDVDGGCKLVLDALQECGAFVNPKGERLSDSHVTGLVVDKRRAEDGRGRTEITVVARS